MMQTFLLACYLCLQLTNLSEDLTQSAILKKETSCNQCLTGLFDNSELLSNMITQPEKGMTSNHALLEVLEERLMFELSRNAMKSGVQQGEQDKKMNTVAEDILSTSESTLRSMQENVMGEMKRRSEEMMEQLQQQQTQLSRELYMLAAKQQNSLVKEATTMKETVKQEQKAPKKNTLNTGIKLKPEEPLVSENGRYKAILMWNGELVVIDQQKNRVAKKLGTSGNYAVPCEYIMLKPDGSLVIKSTHSSLADWTTEADSDGSLYGHILKLENDGQLVVYNVLNRRIWTSGFV